MSTSEGIPRRSDGLLSQSAGKDAQQPTTPNDDVELKDVETSRRPEAAPPLEEDIMQLARLGEIASIKDLFESGKFDATYRDKESISPLHWAAINNRYELCKFLLDSGADVNAKGGESVATPAMWAAQRCHYYIVDLLLRYGADPLLTDIQGYNILHLATIDGNSFLLALLLHQEIPVDIPDAQGHTSLMWAAYKGFPACVDLFLRWGANLAAADEAGLTPLHWALVRGSTPCIQKIVEYGADRFAKTRDGKTPSMVAQDMKTTSFWHRALKECGYNRDGDILRLPLGLTTVLRTPRYAAKFFFFWPFAIILVTLLILSNFSVYISIPFAVIGIASMQWLAQWVANHSHAEFRVLQRTPFLAGVFAGSLALVGVRWFLAVLPGTYLSYPFLNLCFAILFSVTGYFYVLSMVEDPGYVPRLTSRNQQRAAITELLGTWRFDEEHFCIFCMARKPLRSKHCRRCKRCVSKHDHHCPWIDNCVGTNNFRHFVLYIFSMEIGVILFIRLVIAHLLSIPAPENDKCNILSSSLCSYVKRDTFTVILTLWVGLQLIWVTMLCIVQIIQISRNQTTYENMKGNTFDHVNPASRALTSALTAGTTSASIAGFDSAGQGPNPALPPQRHPNHVTCLSQWKKILGLDTFMATAQGGLGDHRRTAGRRNPFSRGIVTNCRDFWCDAAPIFGKRESGTAFLGGERVNYNDMYDLPLRMSRGRGIESGMVYRSVATEDAAHLA